MKAASLSLFAFYALKDIACSLIEETYSSYVPTMPPPLTPRFPPKS